jgi:hypothetical protein
MHSKGLMQNTAKCILKLHSNENVIFIEKKYLAEFKAQNKFLFSSTYKLVNHSSLVCHQAWSTRFFLEDYLSKNCSMKEFIILLHMHLWSI